MEKVHIPSDSETAYCSGKINYVHAEHLIVENCQETRLHSANHPENL
jgi:hypothetical protein